MRAKLFAILFFLFIFVSSSFAFSINSGYYVGKSESRSITGVGFQPDLVMLSSDQSFGGNPVFVTSAMPVDSTADLSSASGVFPGGVTSLDTDGFSLGTNTNVNNTSATYYGARYTWTAFSGSGDGTFKVGSYTGSNVDGREITGLGFQPALVIIKRDGASNAVWHSSAMGADSTEYFVATAPFADGIQSLTADGFTVGANDTVNELNDIYYYVAFKEVAGSFDVGTYDGNSDGATNDNRSIGSVGFQPDFVLTKLSGTQIGAMRTNRHYGDESQIMASAYNPTNHIQAFEADGFQIGTNARVNLDAGTYYYFAFTGVPATSYTGNYTFKSGYYTGNDTGKSITGVGFSPDLVIIKGDGAQYSVFATSMLPDNSTAYLGVASRNVTGAISSLDSDGFSVGDSNYVNDLNQVYRWYAFGNANCSNFILGAYSGNGIASRDITEIGIDPDLLVVKSSLGNYNGAWRTSSMAGESSAYFINLADADNRIQDLDSDGFQVGSSDDTNHLNYVYQYFAFVETEGMFHEGTYLGTGDDGLTISGLSGKPNYLWIKNPGAVYGVQRGVNLSGDWTQYFRNASNVPNRIQALNATGFEVGSSAAAEVNTAATTYWYAAWLGTATKTGFLTQPSTTAAGSVITPGVAVAVQDQFGNTLDYDSSTSVTLSILTNPGSGTLSGTLTRTVSGGVATFEGLSIDKTGTGYVLQAAATGFTAGSSEAFDITPATGTSISFVNQPSTREINTVFAPSLEVVVKDVYGNIQTSDNTTLVTLSIGNNPSQGTLAGTTTKTVASGQAFFNDLSINFRGVGYTLTASAPYITSITSEGFDITAESVAPTIIYYSPTNEGEGVSLESKMIFKFSESMNQAAVQNAFSLLAVRNNSGTAITNNVGGTFSWTSSSTVEFTPTTNWDYSYMYQITMSANARDSVGNGITNPVAFTFNTLGSSGAVSTTVADDGLTSISLPAGAIAVPFYVRINTSPEADPIRVNPAQISSASDKVEEAGDQFNFVLDGSLREFVIYDSNGNVLGSSFGSDATVVLPFTDADGDGYVDGVTPPVRVADLKLCRLDETNGVWIVYPDSIVNNSDNTVSASVWSLSTFGVMARASTAVDDVYVFPSPFKAAEGHTTMTFANLPSTCTIKIYTMTGRVIGAIEETNGDRQATWDVKDSGGASVVSGLYLYVVESSTAKKTGKFAIIR